MLPMPLDDNTGPHSARARLRNYISSIILDEENWPALQQHLAEATQSKEVQIRRALSDCALALGNGLGIYDVELLPYENNAAGSTHDGHWLTPQGKLLVKIIAEVDGLPDISGLSIAVERAERSGMTAGLFLVIPALDSFTDFVQNLTKAIADRYLTARLKVLSLRDLFQFMHYGLGHKIHMSQSHQLVTPWAQPHEWRGLVEFALHQSANQAVYDIMTRYRCADGVHRVRVNGQSALLLGALPPNTKKTPIYVLSDSETTAVRLMAPPAIVQLIADVQDTDM